MPGKLVRAGRDKILQRGIKIAESSLPSWLTEAAMEARDAVLAALTQNVNSRILQPANPAGDSILFWDASAEAYVPLSHTAPLVISGTTLSISAATGSATGLMSAADKVKFDAATSGANASSIMMRDATNTSAIGSLLLTATQSTDIRAATRKDYVDGKVAAITYSTLGTVPTSSLPPLAINETFAVANQAAMLALTAQRGDMAIRSDNGRTYVLATDSPSTLADWKEIMAAGQVQSVAGKTGVVALAKGDVGLGNVDNTSDANKPVSTAQQTALDKLAKGMLYQEIGTGQPVIPTSGDVIIKTIPTFTFKGGRKYKIIWDFSCVSANSGVYIYLRVGTAALADAAGSTAGVTVVGRGSTVRINQGGLTESVQQVAYFTPAADITAQLKWVATNVAGGGTVTMIAGGEPQVYTIEDQGAQF